MKLGVVLDMTAASDVGLQRANNEDSFLLLEQERLCVVADGMGGHLGGEVASSMVTRILEEEFTALADDEEPLQALLERLRDAVERANLDIFERGNEEPELRNMGTTVVATLFRAGHILWASVGDSRIYRLRGGELEQITSDHSWVGELRRKNLISEEDARLHPLKNIITRALGMESTVEVDTAIEKVRPGDLYLLCSDGLTDLMDNKGIRKVLVSGGADLEECADLLIDTANQLGGIDNITVGLCRVTDS